MAQSISPSGVVHIPAGDFRWEDIPGKGRCLVPVACPVSAYDVTKCRRYLNTRGRMQAIVKVFGLDEVGFYTVLGPQGYCCAAGVATQSAGELAETINRHTRELTNTSELAFKEWVK